MDGTKKASGKALKLGGYSTLFIVIAIAVVIVINLLVGKIPASYTKLDLTNDKLYSISEQTKSIVSGLADDVTIYLIAATGSESAAITELLDRYEPLSDRLRIEYKDPVLYPTFTSQFTSESVTSNSLIVTSARRTKVVPYSDIVVTSYDYTTGASSSSFDGENQLTGAIDYVTSDSLPVLYQITGHGEAGLSDSLTSSVIKQNISLESLVLASVEAVPEDASSLLITAPSTDFTQDDIAKLTAYMQSGGSLVYVSNYLDEELTNLHAFMGGYGLSLVDGIVVEGDLSHMLYSSGGAYPHYLLPNLGSHAISDPLIDGGYIVLYPISQGIEISPSVRSTLTITELLTTSNSAYSKTDIANMTTYEKEAGDIEGPFAVAVAAEDSKFGGKLVWYTTYGLIDDSVNSTVSGGNFDLFLNTLGWTCEHESSITIRSKSLSVEYLNINAADGMSLNIFFIGLLPLAALVTGGVVWYRRKKR